MVPDKIDRLGELDVDNVQKLANENPIILWVRTPYTLDVIIDWVSQAQLAILFEDTALKKLRDVGIRDIFQYVECLTDIDGKSAIQQHRQIPPAIVGSHQRSILDCPFFQRLHELRRAIEPARQRPVEPPLLRAA